MSAFDFVTSKKEKLRRKDAATIRTAGQPTGSVEEARAVTSNLSDSKGTDNSGDKQEILRKSLEESMAEAAKQDYGSGVGKERYDDVMIDLWDSCVFSVGTCLAKGLLLIVF